MKVRLGTVSDIQSIVNLAQELQSKMELYVDVPVQSDTFSYWLLSCILSPSIEILISEDNDGIQGFLVLQENTYHWNSAMKCGTDLLFLCRKGGLNLINTAKRIKQKRKWKHLMLSTTANQGRSDQFLSRIGKKVGGVYYV